MESGGTSILGILMMLFLLGCMFSIVFMMVSMAQKGDERRREIIARASSTTLYITVGSLVLDMIYGVYQSIAHNLPMEGNNPFVQLAVVSFVYAISLAVYKRRYGG